MGVTYIETVASVRNSTRKNVQMVPQGPRLPRKKAETTVRIKAINAAANRLEYIAVIPIQLTTGRIRVEGAQSACIRSTVIKKCTQALNQDPSMLLKNAGSGKKSSLGMTIVINSPAFSIYFWTVNQRSTVAPAHKRKNNSKTTKT